MSASGINWGWRRAYFQRAGICTCDHTNGDSCHRCDGSSGDGGAALAANRAAVAAVEAREPGPPA